MAPVQPEAEQSFGSQKKYNYFSILQKTAGYECPESVRQQMCGMRQMCGGAGKTEVWYRSEGCRINVVEPHLPIQGAPVDAKETGSLGLVAGTAGQHPYDPL